MFSEFTYWGIWFPFSYKSLFQFWRLTYTAGSSGNPGKQEPACILFYQVSDAIINTQHYKSELPEGMSVSRHVSAFINIWKLRLCWFQQSNPYLCELTELEAIDHQQNMASTCIDANNVTSFRPFADMKNIILE